MSERQSLNVEFRWFFAEADLFRYSPQVFYDMTDTYFLLHVSLCFCWRIQDACAILFPYLLFFPCEFFFLISKCVIQFLYTGTVTYLYKSLCLYCEERCKLFIESSVAYSSIRVCDVSCYCVYVNLYTCIQIILPILRFTSYVSSPCWCIYQNRRPICFTIKKIFIDYLYLLFSNLKFICVKLFWIKCLWWPISKNLKSKLAFYLINFRDDIFCFCKGTDCVIRVACQCELFPSLFSKFAILSLVMYTINDKNKIIKR